MPVPFSLDTAPLAPLPRSGERVLVLAPHPDDETLGAGGWIYSCRQQGAHVRILFLTDGDAFRLAALTSERRLPAAAACRALGERRRFEANTAAATLGVGRESLRFLGYPDRGVAALRRSVSSSCSYRSPYTARAVTAEGSHRPGRPYCGNALLDDLSDVFRTFRPHYLLYPDPDDDHGDHRATAWFAAQALRRLTPEEGPLWAGSYLIHHGHWPLPHRYSHDGALLPPTSLQTSGRHWERFPLATSALQAKAAALNAHISQHLWAADLFGAHVRSNELFSCQKTRGIRSQKDKGLGISGG